MYFVVIPANFISSTDGTQAYFFQKFQENSVPNQMRNLSGEKSRGLSSTVIEVMRMLPPGYNISKIPKPVIDALFRGEVPDFTLLPSELQQHLLTDGHRLISALSIDVCFHVNYYAV